MEANKCDGCKRAKNSDIVYTCSCAVKDSWSREEVENKIQKFRLYSLKFGLDANTSNKWINENL